MMKKILDLGIKKTFFYIFSIYFLFGMHISLDHIGGYGLYLPFNIIGWIFVSFLIGMGFYQISRSETLFITQLQIYCLIGFALLLIPFCYPNNFHANLALMRIMGLLGGLLLYFSFSQFQFSKEEKDKLFEECSKDKDLMDVVLIALLTGARQGEIIGLRWEDIDFDDGLLYFRRTKNKEIDYLKAWAESGNVISASKYS